MKKLLDNYSEWLKERMSLTQHGEWFEITTPFLNNHNDFIQIYARYQGSSIQLTDAGETINDLELSGVSFDRSDNRRKELRTILNGFGIDMNDSKELQVIANENNFPQIKHRLFQAILSIGDMFMLAEPKVENFFFEDVAIFLDSNDIPTVPNVGFIGKSGFSHTFEFSIPKTKKTPERLLKLLNYPRQDLLEHAIWTYEDTRKIRPDSRGVVILNDESKKVGDEMLSALSTYELIGIRWSERYEQLSQLKD